MATVRDHYDRHLGPIYEWMIGDVEHARVAAAAELQAMGLGDGRGRVAVDLGCGPGWHALGLAEAGFSVTALDTCSSFLHRLDARPGARAIRRVCDDLQAFARYVLAADVVVCLGDTLTHLESIAAVERLLDDVATSLSPGGTFVATFRDYSRPSPAGAARFIQVRQDKDRLLTCFLEYGHSTLEVYDLLHERTDAGWTLRVSSYPKLRLDPAHVRGTLEQLGLQPRLDLLPNGMVRVTATKSVPRGRTAGRTIR